MATTERMRLTKYGVPVDLYTSLRVKSSFSPNLEAVGSLDSLGLEAPLGSLRVGIIRVPASMIERRWGDLAPAPSPMDQERVWVVAEFPGRRYVALGQFIPESGRFQAPSERSDLEYRVDAR